MACDDLLLAGMEWSGPGRINHDDLIEEQVCTGIKCLGNGFCIYAIAKLH